MRAQLKNNTIWLNHPFFGTLYFWTAGKIVKNFWKFGDFFLTILTTEYHSAQVTKWNSKNRKNSPYNKEHKAWINSMPHAPHLLFR